MWVLPVPLFKAAMTFSRRWMYSHRAGCITGCLFTEGMAGKSKVSRLFTAGKRAARTRRSTMRSLVPVYELKFGQAQQVLRVVHTLGGALGRHLPIFPQEAGQLQFLQMVFQKQCGTVAHAALPDSNVM